MLSCGERWPLPWDQDWFFMVGELVGGMGDATNLFSNEQ